MSGTQAFWHATGQCRISQDSGGFQRFAVSWPFDQFNRMALGKLAQTFTVHVEIMGQVMQGVEERRLADDDAAGLEHAQHLARKL